MRRIFLLTALLYAIAAASAQTGNTTIQPDCLIPFTFAAAGSFPSTTVAGGPGDNRTKGCAAWTLMYQNTGMTSVTVTLQSGSSVSTTVTYGSFAGTISTGYVNPIVSDTGGSVQATNGTADISWVRVNVAATGAGTLTGVLYGFRNSSAAVAAPVTNCPAGAAGDVQYYVSAGVCGGSANFTRDLITGQVTIIGDGTGTPANGLHSNWNLTTAVDTFRGLTVDVTSPGVFTTNSAVRFQMNRPSSVDDMGLSSITGVESGVSATGSGRVGSMTSVYGEIDINNTVQTDFMSAFWSPMYVSDTSIVAKLAGIYIDVVSKDPGATITDFFVYWSGDQAGVATNTYYSWFDSRGVRRVKEDNTFNSVGQAIEALYNPQFTKYTPGAANYERIILGQWESNVAVIATENGGTGTLRALRFDAASVSTGVTFQAGGYLSSDASVGTTGNGFKNGLCVTASGACVGGAPVPAGTTTADEQCWASASTFGVCANTTISGRATEGSATLTADVVNPFIQAKNTQSATAPGAAKCDLRWIAGTNATTGKIVAACGTSATEVTIADNVGNAF